jgi:transglutaminase-like putative cysteine protease
MASHFPKLAARTAAMVAGVLGLIASAGTPAERRFEFRYEVEIGPLPPEARKIALWVPYPSADPWQEIGPVHVDAPFKAEVRKDPKYGNALLYLAAEKPGPGPIRLTMDFAVRRRERIAPLEGSASGGTSPSEDPARWLQPDRRVPLDEKIRSLAQEVTRGKTTPLEKARAIYDYVVSTMRYDKSGQGWGQGDIYWACDAKRGNCTDFHALFIGLCRAAGIPAKFAIGFPLPRERGQGEVGGYHCWAEFYLEGRGWIPVDASEAWKDPSRRDYFFGAHDENRVQFSVGRDLVLDPPQRGEPLNYFIYPYVEVDGKPWPDVKKRFSYRDVEAIAGAASRPAGS